MDAAGLPSANGQPAASAVQAAPASADGSSHAGIATIDEEEAANCIQIEDPGTEYDPFSAFKTALEWGLVHAPRNTRNAAMSTAPLPPPPVQAHIPEFKAQEKDGLRDVALGMFNDGKADFVALNSVMSSGSSHVDSAYCVAEVQGRKRSSAAKPAGERGKAASAESASETRSLTHSEFLRAYPGGDLNPLAMVRVGQYQPAPALPAEGGAAEGEDAAPAQSSGPQPVDLVGDDSQSSDAVGSGGRRPSRRAAASGPATAPTHLTLPMHVQIMPEAAVVMDFHAHMALSEVIGLLGGTVAPPAAPGQPGTLVVHAAFPCQAVPIADDHMTNVEMAPESEVQVRTAIAARGLQCVGWYHSHPTFQATPSVKDCENQLTYQGYMADSKPVLPEAAAGAEASTPPAAGALPCCASAGPATPHTAVKAPASGKLPHDTVPFIGVIVSPYNTDNPEDLSEVTVFNCTPLPGMVPMALPTTFPASRPAAAAAQLLPADAPSAHLLTVPHDAVGVPRHSDTAGVLTTAWLTDAVTSISASAHKHLTETHCEVPLEDLGRVSPSHPPYLAMAPAAEHVPEELLHARAARGSAKGGRYKTPKKARPSAKALGSVFRPSPLPAATGGADAAIAAMSAAAAAGGAGSARKRSGSSTSKQSPPVDAIPLSDLLGDASASLPVLSFGDELPPVPHEIACVCRTHGWDPTDVRALEQEIKLRGVESMRGCMWRVRIFLNSKVVFEGRGEDFIQAARQYDRKCLELRGEDAEVNFPSEAQAQAPRALLARMRAAGKPLQWKLARGRRRRLKDKEGQPLEGRTPAAGDGSKLAYTAAASALSAAATAAADSSLGGGTPRGGLVTPPHFAGGDTHGGSATPAADVQEFKGPSAEEAPLRNVTVGDAVWSVAHAQAVTQPPYPHARHANPFKHALNVDLERFAASVAAALPQDDPTAVAAVRDMMVRHKYAQLVAALGVAAAAGTAAAAQLVASPAHAQAAAAAASTAADGSDAGAPKTPAAVKAKLAGAAAAATARSAEAGALDRQRYVIVHYTQQAMAVARHAAEAAVLVLAHPAAESTLLEAVAPLRSAWQQGVALGGVRGVEAPPPAATLWCPEAEAALSHAVAVMRQLRSARLAQWQTLLTAAGRDAEAEVAALAGMPPARGAGRAGGPAGGRKRPRSGELTDAVLDGRHAEAASGGDDGSLAHPALALKVPLLAPVLAPWSDAAGASGLLPETSLQMPAVANAALRLRMAYALHAAYPPSVHSALGQLVDVAEHYRVHPARVLLTRPWRRGLVNFTKLAAVLLAWAQLLPLPPALRGPFAWDVAALLWFGWLPVWSPTPRPQPVPALPSQRILGLLRGSRNKRPAGSHVARLGKGAAAEEAAAAASARQCAVDLLSLAAVGIGPGADADVEAAAPAGDGGAPGAHDGVPPQRPPGQRSAGAPQPLHRHAATQQRLLASAVSGAHAEAMAAAAPGAVAPSATLPGALPRMPGAGPQRVQLLSAGAVQSISLQQAEAAVASSKGQYVLLTDPRSNTLTLLPSSGAQAFLQHARVQQPQVAQ